MQKITVTKTEEGQQLLKFLGKYLKKAPVSFFYKMMRKKNITLNGKKVEGKETVKQGDEVSLFLSDDTILLFGGDALFQNTKSNDVTNATKTIKNFDFDAFQNNVLYEDDDILIVNKPAGLLTQKAEADDISLNELAIEYLKASGSLTEQALMTFHPSVCNRLDRNTSGIVCIGKTIVGLQFLSAAFKNRTVHKFYECLVHGELKKRVHLKGYLKKESGNQVVIVTEKPENDKEYDYIETIAEPIAYANGVTKMQVELITGKTHQIRAHFASIGHPILGDSKYAEMNVAKQDREQYGLKFQLLHAKRLVFGHADTEKFQYLENKEIIANNPPLFHTVEERIFR